MINKLVIILICILSAFILIYASSVESCFYQTDKKIEINRWIGTTSNNECIDPENNKLMWSCPQNWSKGVKPQSNDIITFDSSSVADSYIDISFQVYGMYVEQGYTGTISKNDSEILKIGSEGLKMKGGNFIVGNSTLNPKDGELNVTLGNYKDLLGNDKIVIERVAFTCSDEVLAKLTSDFNTFINKPISSFSDIFVQISQNTQEMREKEPHPFFNVINLSLILINLIILITLFKIRRSYGVIRDKVSKEPIKFTPFKILLGASTNISYRGLSDIEGRYSFPVITGSYRIEVSKDGYNNYTKKINVNSIDIFTNFVEDIELEPIASKKYEAKDNYASVWKYKILPTIIKLYPMILALSLLNLFYLLNSETNKLYLSLSTGIYIIYVFIFFFYLIKPRPQLFEIVDSQNGLRIPNVLVKIIDHKNNKLIDTKITNHDGFFESAILKGEYALFISHVGYNYPSKFIASHKKVLISSKELLVMNFKPNGQKNTIYLDPVNQNKFIP